MRHPTTFICAILLFISTSGSVMAEDQKTIKTWAVAEFGEPLYKDGLEHFPYANPDAPKGGKIVLSSFGSYDTLNFYVLKGDWPDSIGLVYDGLMSGSGDEIDGSYGLIAESVEYPEDKSWAIFTLRPEARYHDGKPIRAQDFVFAFDTVLEHGRPFIKSFYTDVESAEALDDRRVKFTFKTKDTMKPMMQVAGMYPLPMHYWEGKDVTASTLDAPLSSGPYRVKKLEPGRSITYERVKDYWAKDLPLKRGLNNFDEIRYDFYRDLTVRFEAFKAGEIDFRSENSAKRWVTEYDMAELKQGKIIKREVPTEAPRGMGGFFFNLRQPKFEDIRVRQALLSLYDFEAIQRTLLYGKYKRIASFFPNSDYGASGPPTPDEIAILEPFRDQLPAALFSDAFTPPKTDGSGRDRRNKRTALKLFKEAGWSLQDSKLVSQKTGEQLQVELMTSFPESQRLALPFVEAMRGMGIDASVRLVDSSQWRVRIHDSDFDLWTGAYNFFPPPGTELRNYFGSESADIRGGNSGGIKNPVVDALIEKIIKAKDLATLQATNRALDRVLLWNYYVIPAYYNDESWIAYWNKFGYPDRKPRYSIGFPGTWWLDQDLALKLD